MAKENFIEALSSMTPKEINTLIENKGKKPRLVPMMYRLNDGKFKINNTTNEKNK